MVKKLIFASSAKIRALNHQVAKVRISIFYCSNWMNCCFLIASGDRANFLMNKTVDNFKIDKRSGELLAGIPCLLSIDCEFIAKL